jgi:hypothetical protein
MAIRLKRKNSSGYVWQSSDLVEGQVGLNIADGTMHFKKADNTVITVGSGTGATSLDGLTDVTITTPATDQILKYDGTGWINATSPGGITDLVSDTSPQLGGNLDVNGNSIVSVSNGNINLTPNGTGRVIVDGVTISNAVGSNNLAIGVGSSLIANTTGIINTAVNGQQSNTTGSYNTSCGFAALHLNETGSRNTAVGVGALNKITTSDNIAIGYNAGESITTGSNNTIIGSLVGTTTLSDTVLIAAGTTERVKVDSTGLYINGSLFTGAGALDDLTDVTITTASNNQTLVWDSTNLYWKNTALKTVNSNSLIGSGDIAVQATLVSGTNIKTINGSSILGSGDLTVEGGTGGSSGFDQTFLLMGA